MKTNKMGIHDKRNKNGFLNTLLSMITKIEHRRFNLHKEVTVTGNICLDEQNKKTLLEADVKKSQAAELIRKLQNR
jgi:hypothetical protein